MQETKGRGGGASETKKAQEMSPGPRVSFSFFRFILFFNNLLVTIDNKNDRTVGGACFFNLILKFVLLPLPHMSCVGFCFLFLNINSIVAPPPHVLCGGGSFFFSF